MKTSIRPVQIPQLLLSAFFPLLAFGCASDHRRAGSEHEIRCFAGRADGLVRVERWSDTERGGGVFVLTDPSAVNLVASHTNQSALGGGSLFTAGSLEVRVDSNAVPIIGATGTAAGNIIGATAKAAVK